MNLPTSRGSRALGAVIDTRMSQYTFDRPSAATGAMGGVDTDSDVTADIWLFRPMEVQTDTDFGERLTGELGGLALPTADIQVGDRVTYQSTEYEVAETETFDGQTSDTYLLVTLQRYNA